MKISEVMTREVATVQADQTAQEAANFMLQGDAGSIPVTEGEKLIGMITDRDIAVRGVAKGHGPDTKVRDLMASGRSRAPGPGRRGARPEDRRADRRPARRRHRRSGDQKERSAGPAPAGDRRV